MKTLFGIFLLFISLGLGAQEFHYERWGESQFSGKHIYDVIQDNDRNFIFSTNTGIFSFDGKSYSELSCEAMNSREVFNFVKNSEGDIFCVNLNNQVLKITDGKIGIYKTIPDSLQFPTPRLSVNSQDDLIVHSTFFNRPYVYQLNKGLDTLISIPEQDKGYIQSTFFDPDKKKNILYKKYFTPDENNFTFYYIFLFNGDSLVYNYLNKSLNKIKDDTLIFQKDLSPYIGKNGHPRIYPINKNLFIATNKTGLLVLNENLELKYPERMFRDYLISDIYLDFDSTIWFSTFNEGVLLTKNTQFTRSNFKIEKPAFTLIHTHSDSIILLGSNKGGVYHTDTHLDSISLIAKKEKHIEKISFWKHAKAIIYDIYLVPFDKKENLKNEIEISLLKDAFQNNQGDLIIGSSNCITTYSKSTKIEYNQKNINYSGRVYNLAYDTISENIWIAGSKGLAVLDSSGKETEILYKKSALYIKQVELFNDKVYLLDNFQKMLVGNEKKWEPIAEIKADKFHICSYGIITMHSNRISAYNHQGEFVNSLGSAEGFTHFKVVDFDVLKETLFLLNSNVIVKIPLSLVFTKNPVIDNFKIYAFQNDTLITDTKFKYNDNNVEFRFTNLNFKNKDDISIRYILEGFSDKWKTTKYDDYRISYRSLSPGNYSFRAYTISDNQISKEHIYNFTILAPFYLKWWFIIIIVCIGILLITFLVKLLVTIQEKKIIARNEINAFKLTAIQSQMNPHFIFNSLNSLQGLILKGNVEKSYTYLNRFSDLIRSTVDNINEDYIDLQQELKLIETYLILEKNRFSDSFVFEINNEIKEHLKIPPMLIQPFIENSLLHGLLHKRGDKKLSISFRYSKYVICTIEDNGIGRVASHQIKIRQAKSHKSFALNAIQKRFNILNKKSKMNFGFTYTDLEKNGKSAGVRVELRLPIKTI